MVKGRGVGKDGRPFVLLGLSHENVARLFADEPIVVITSLPPDKGVGLEGGPDIILIAGTTEEEMEARLRATGMTVEVNE